VSLVLAIESELDQRSANAAADRAKQIYKDAARDMSKSMSEGLTKGAREGGRAVEKMADEARSAYKRVGDATDELKEAERQLKQMRADGARGVEVQAEVVRRARRQEREAIREAADALQTYERAARSAQGAASGIGSEFRAGLRTGLNDAVQDFTSQFGVMGNMASSTFAGMSMRSAGAAAGIAGVGVAAVAAGKQLYDLGSTWDSVGDSIALRTGKLGADLDAITTSVRNLGGETAAPLETIGDVAGRVSQSLGLTGAQLEDMTKTLAEYQAMAGEQIDVRGLGKSFELFDIQPDDAMSALDSLYESSVETGLSINDLIGSMNNAGKAAQQFGLGFGETAGLLSTLDEAGLDFNRVAPSLTIALRNFAKAGQEPQQALRDTVAEIKRLTEAGKEAEAINLASSTFGRGYVDFFSAIKSGKLDVDALDASLGRNGESLSEVLDATKDWSESWQQFKNNASSALEPLATTVFTQINNQLEGATTAVTTFGDIIGGLGEAWKQVAAAIAGNPIQPTMAGPGGNVPVILGPNGEIIPSGNTPSAPNPLLVGPQIPPTASGPVSLDGLLGIPGAPGSPGQPLGPGGAGGTAAGGAGLTLGGIVNPQGGWYTPPGNQGGAASLPDAPVLPIQYTNTAGMPTSIANATTRVDETAHAVAEKEARLNQLRASNLADESEIQKAENDLAKANQDQNQAERALVDAKNNLIEQQIRETQKGIDALGRTSDQLGQIGAQIDQDFGVSEGLPGIAENLTKFLANLAFAPVYGALTGVREAAGFGQGEAGGGLMGMLASSGAFGDQYMPVPRWARQGGGGSSSDYGMAAAMNPMALPGMPGGTPYAGVPIGTSGDVTNQPGLDLIRSMGLKGTTYASHTNDGAATDREVDVTDPSGGNGLARLAEFARQNPGLFEEFIYSDPSTGQKTGIRSGQLVGPGTSQPGYYAQNWAGHQDHVHMEPAKGGGLGFGDGPDETMYGPGGTPWSANWNAIAQGESSGNWQINTGNGYYGGLQFKQSSWDAAGGQQYAPRADLASPYQQAMAGENLLHMQGPGAWPNTFVPGSAGPAGPAAPSQTATGGRAYAQGMPASGGIGFGGGLIGAAMSAAGSMAGGLGGGVAAAGSDMAMQLIGRAIGAGGQYMGNLVGAGIETFLPNGSALGDPSSSWFGRLAGAAAGIRPSLPNTAGALGGEQNKAMAEAGKKPLTPEQAKAGADALAASGGKESAVGKGGDTYNIDVKNTRAREDGTGRDIQNSLMAGKAAQAPSR
jgi:TP901 family phage tail tape measure protein